MPVQVADASLVVDTSPDLDPWCAFEHLAALEAGHPPQVIYVGACRLVDVFRLTEGKTNSDWSSLFANGGYVLVRIIATGTRQDIVNYATRHVRTFDPMPRCNVRGYNVRGARRAVICNNNGTTYRNQSEAAAELGVTQSAISQHLDGKLSSVRGYTFRYAAPHEMAQQ